MKIICLFNKPKNFTFALLNSSKKALNIWVYDYADVLSHPPKHIYLGVRLDLYGK